VTPESFRDLLAARRSRRDFAPGTLPRQALEGVLRAGLGQAGESQLTAPSAGALYPLHLFVAAGSVEDLEPALYRWHDRTGFDTLHPDSDLRAALEDAALEEQPWVGRAPAVIVIAADLAAANAAFHEQQPDGRRGERYAAMETGAVAQSFYLAAETLGLAGVLIGGIDDAATGDALKLPDGLTPLALFLLGLRDG